jgi:hypothetical protein
MTMDTAGGIVAIMIEVITIPKILALIVIGMKMTDTQNAALREV